MKNKKIRSTISPVLLFTFNRLSHLKKTINLQKIIYIDRTHNFSDGPKEKKDIRKINEVRKYVSKIEGFKNIKVYNEKKILVYQKYYIGDKSGF